MIYHINSTLVFCGIFVACEFCFPGCLSVMVDFLRLSLLNITCSYILFGLNILKSYKILNNCSILIRVLEHAIKVSNYHSLMVICDLKVDHFHVP